MTFVFVLAAFEARRRQKILERRTNRYLRTNMCVLSMPETRFLHSFRMDKATFTMILEQVKPHLKVCALSPSLQLAAVLRFLATGCYQSSVVKDNYINIGRSTFSKILHDVIPIMQHVLCEKAISLKMTKEYMRLSSDYFYRKSQLPRIVGCVTGMHIQIQKPVQHEALFYNRKGFFSLNAVVICNYKQEIMFVDASRHGSCQDCFSWSLSPAREYLSRAIDGHFLVADSGYALETFVLTPYRSAELGSMQHKFNKRHAAARSIADSTTAMLKTRFRCLQRSLNYEPSFVAQITNVCCALHNICRRRSTPLEGVIEQDDYFESDEDNDVSDQEDGASIRDEIARSLAQE